HRGAQANEIVSWDHFLGQSLLQREVFFNELVLTCRRSMINRAVHGAGQENDPTRFLILGSDITFTIEDWRKREGKIKDRTKAVVPKQKSYARFSLVSEPEVLVTAIASLYKGGRYISNFMENITSQSIFRDYCELVIVDASSPENEFEVIQPYLERFPNIKYFRTQNRIGIYEAWNLAISKSQGKFITNTNLDDLRRTDSFELQTSTLENVSFADVVYQDFLYSIDASLTFDEVSSFYVVSNLPVVCRNNLLSFNSPHNAPMWRRSLHNEVGLFDTTYRSAGDWEFWLRCAIAGKQFYKINDPHVVSFANPEGVSTRPDTRGLEESYQITRALARKVLSEHLVCDPERFLEEVCRRSGQNFAMSKEDSASEDWRYLVVQRALRQVSAA
ncbi:MAG TPA: glycosyltransferase, partial [Candidatus Acidoferrum sp.]